MNLFILTESDGSPIADKTTAAVASVTDSTLVDDLGNLILGDSEPLIVKFTTGTAAPAFAGDATYSISVSLGAVSADGSMNYSSNSDFTVVTGGWSGRLSLNTNDLISAVQTRVGGVFATMGGGGPSGAWLALQVRVTNPSGFTTTYLQQQVFVEWRVVSANLGADNAAPGALLSANNLSDVSSAATSRINIGLGPAGTPTFASQTISGTFTHSGQNNYSVSLTTTADRAFKWSGSASGNDYTTTFQQEGAGKHHIATSGNVAASGLVTGAGTGSHTFGTTNTVTLSAGKIVATAAGNALGTVTSSSTALNLPSSTTAVSSLRLAHGSAPTSPVDGDIWTTSVGLFVRVNGVTVGPLT